MCAKFCKLTTNKSCPYSSHADASVHCSVVQSTVQEYHIDIGQHGTTCPENTWEK